MFHFCFPFCAVIIQDALTQRARYLTHGMLFVNDVVEMVYAVNTAENVSIDIWDIHCQSSPGIY